MKNLLNVPYLPHPNFYIRQYKKNGSVTTRIVLTGLFWLCIQRPACSSQQSGSNPDQASSRSDADGELCLTEGCVGRIHNNTCS